MDRQAQNHDRVRVRASSCACVRLSSHARRSRAASCWSARRHRPVRRRSPARGNCVMAYVVMAHVVMARGECVPAGSKRRTPCHLELRQDMRHTPVRDVKTCDIMAIKKCQSCVCVWDAASAHVSLAVHPFMSARAPARPSVDPCPFRQCAGGAAGGS